MSTRSLILLLSTVLALGLTVILFIIMGII